jgi:hypothetical protein
MIKPQWQQVIKRLVSRFYEVWVSTISRMIEHQVNIVL